MTLFLLLSSLFYIYTYIPGRTYTGSFLLQLTEMFVEDKKDFCVYSVHSNVFPCKFKVTLDEAVKYHNKLQKHTRQILCILCKHLKL